MKSLCVDLQGDPGVAPFTGAWIEISGAWSSAGMRMVAPFTGAWIEIASPGSMMRLSLSHPSRVRGLKSGTSGVLRWFDGRTLHGCVD